MIPSDLRRFTIHNRMYQFRKNSFDSFLVLLVPVMAFAFAKTVRGIACQCGDLFAGRSAIKADADLGECAGTRLATSFEVDPIFGLNRPRLGLNASHRWFPVVIRSAGLTHHGDCSVVRLGTLVQWGCRA